MITYDSNPKSDNGILIPVTEYKHLLRCEAILDLCKCAIENGSSYRVSDYLADLCIHPTAGKTDE